VPFRLTPDMVDGCGIAGVEGPLRRCCEVTLRVLRSAKEALLQVGGCVVGLHCCFTHAWGWPEPYIYNVYERIFVGFPAQSTGYIYRIPYLSDISPLKYRFLPCGVSAVMLYFL